MTGQMYCMHLETLGLIHVPELHRLSKYCLFFHSNSQKILNFLVRGTIKHFDMSLSLPPLRTKNIQGQYLVLLPLLFRRFIIILYSVG